MFQVELTHATSSFVVKHTDINNSLVVIADGKFAVDTGNRSMLVIVIHITIPSDDMCLLGKFISDVMSYMGKHFNARVFFRLSMFDRQLDIDKLKLLNQPAYRDGSPNSRCALR